MLPQLQTPETKFKAYIERQRLVIAKLQRDFFREKRKREAAELEVLKMKKLYKKGD